MKTITTALAVLLSSMVMTACAKKDDAAPAEAAPAATAAESAPAETAPAATSEVPANNEDGPQTSGDKVSPKPEAAPAPN